jgi:hypothetical protein
MSELSLAANAVHDAAFSELPDGLCLKAAIAAALRAAATYLPNSVMYPSCDWGYGWRNGIGDAEQKLLAIANELEGANG